MAKTGSEIQTEVMRLLQDSTLANAISGNIYRYGYRPKDSKTEDLIVVFTAADADQIQTGVVTINIYVPDIDMNGVVVENGKRTSEVEALANAWAANLNLSQTDYLFALQKAVFTMPESEIQQHFVVVKLKFDVFTN
ncbi:MAG: hypothetical protein ACRCZB_04250 [Bacteroidales bacterium]